MSHKPHHPMHGKFVMPNDRYIGYWPNVAGKVYTIVGEFWDKTMWKISEPGKRDRWCIKTFLTEPARCA